MRILVTGARAPAALDWVRRLSSAGHTVFVGDSLRFGMAVASRFAHQFLFLPRPVESVQQYVAVLQQMIQKHNIELLIPTCEEVFYLSRFRDQLSCCIVVDDFEKLSDIHNKWTFSQLAGNQFAQSPQTCLLTSVEDISRLNDNPAAWVFKPVFSRFASRTLIEPDELSLRKLRPSEIDPWVAQKRIMGQEYSTYSIARHGQMLAHACYRSKYRAGLGSGIYFLPTTHEPIEHFARTFIESTGFHGQIGFDLIEDTEGLLWVLEGNPRATSGLHMFDDNDPVASAITNQQICVPQLAAPADTANTENTVNAKAGGNEHDLIRPSRTNPLMVEFAMPLWGLADALRRNLWRELIPDMLKARSTSFRLRDPLPSLLLPLSLAELAWIAIRERRSLQQASTFDTEWNGESL